MSLDPVSLGITLALNVASMAMTASQRIEGQRLTDLSVTVADYGTPLNYFLGTRRFEGVPIIWAEKIKEVKRQRKTKGGKYNEYTYFGTWAAVVAAHEIAAVSRMWFDKHLVFDTTGAGPVTPFSLGAGTNLNDLIRIYLGTEAQMPDPRMQATVEAEQGPDSCPAYRGVAYIVFEDIPLDKLGNRIPQISVEAITNATPNYPYSIETPAIDPPNGLDAFAFAWSPDKSRFVWSDGPNYSYWDAASRTSMVEGTWNNLGYSASQGMAVVNDGTIYGIAYTNPATTTYLVTYDPDGLTGGTAIADLFDGGNNFAGADLIACASTVTGDEIVGVKPFSIYCGLAVYDVAGHTLSLDTGPLAWQPHSYFADMEGNIWCVGAYQSASTLVFHRVYGDYGALPDHFEITGMPSAQGVIVSVTAFATDDNFVVLWNGISLNLIDIATQTLTTTVTVTTAELTSIDTYIESVQPGATTFWVDATEYFSADLSVKRAYTDPQLASLWVTGSSIQGTFYDPINNALVSTASADGTLTWRYLDRIGSGDVTLRDVVENVAVRAGIDLNDIDASALTDIVIGWSWTQGSGKDILGPLLDLYDVDAREHGFVLEFLPRGGATGATIDASAFVLAEAEGDGTHTVERGQATDVPRRLTLSFSDVAADQQTNTASFARPLERFPSARELSIDMTPWAADVDSGHQFAARMLRRRHFGRETYTFGLTAQMIGLEAGDVRLLTIDGVAKGARLTLASVDADQVIRTEWERDDPSVAVLNGQAGAIFAGRAPSNILVPVTSKLFVLDIPLLRDADNDTNPLLYFGAAPYSAAGLWTGARIMQSLDGGVSYEDEWANVASGSGSTWGSASDVLGVADPWLWDRGSEVTVELKYGTLTGATEAECDRNPLLNLALLGDELIQFTTPTLNGDGTWTLSDLKRGRRGTEWAIGTHAIGDRFLLLAEAGHVEMGVSDVGDTERFKAVTAGRDVGSGFPVAVAFAGASLKPLAPAHLTATKNAGSGDWSINGTRRSRIGGAWTGSTSVPLGEATEAYECDVINGVGAVVRTLSGSTLPLTYAEADQIADGGDVAVGHLNLALYQLSAIVDRGFAATASF